MQTNGKDRFNIADIIILKSPLTPWEMRRVSPIYLYHINVASVGGITVYANNKTNSGKKLGFVFVNMLMLLYCKGAILSSLRKQNSSGQLGQSVKLWTSCTCMIKNAVTEGPSDVFLGYHLGTLKWFSTLSLPSSAFFISYCTCVTH